MVATFDNRITLDAVLHKLSYSGINHKIEIIENGCKVEIIIPVKGRARFLKRHRDWLKSQGFSEV